MSTYGYAIVTNGDKKRGYGIINKAGKNGVAAYGDSIDNFDSVRETNGMFMMSIDDKDFHVNLYQESLKNK